VSLLQTYLSHGHNNAYTLPRFAPEAVDRTLRDLRNDDRPFGGVTVVFGGDFRQTLPVVPHGSRADTVAASLRASPLWQHMNILQLQQNMRLYSARHSIFDHEFARFLLDVGSGNFTDSTSPDFISLPSPMRCDNIHTLIQSVYGSMSPSSAIPPPNYFLDRMILAPRNTNVDAINQQVIESFPGETLTYFSADSVGDVTARSSNPAIQASLGTDTLGVSSHWDEDDPRNLPPEFLRSLNPSGYPLGELALKIGCPMILLRNIDVSNGLCNGTRMTLLRASQSILEVRIMGGDHDGKIAFIPRITMTPSQSNAEFTFTLRRTQFPVRLAFAMTINKAQGQSVKYVGLDLRSDVFSHGQLYVALSRVTTRSGLKFCLADGVHRSNDSNIKNCVYKEVLL
jgi:hypothetical protein